MIHALSLYVATLAPEGFASPPPPPPQDPPRVLEILSLHSFAPPRHRVEMPRLGSQLLDWESEDLQIDLSERTPAIDTDMIATILGDHELRALDDGELDLDEQDSLLFVRGSAETVQRIKRAYAEIEALVQRSVTLHAHVIALPEGGATIPKARLDGAETAALLDAADVIWSGRTSVPVGEPTSLGHHRFVPYLRDVDVEVAQKSSISDPIIRRFSEGLHILASAHALTTPGDVVVEALYSFSEQQGPMQTLPTRVKDQPSLDTPHLREMSGAFSGRLASGGSLVVSGWGTAGGPNVAIVLTAELDAMPQTSHITALPISALTSSELGYLPTSWEDESQGWPTSIAQVANLDSVESEPSLSSDLLQDMITTRLPQFEESEDCALINTDRYLWVRGPAAVRRQAVQLVAQLEQRFLVDDEHELTVSGTNGALWSVRTPALRDRWHALFCGSETTVIADYEVEIAQNSAIANPVVRSVFSGIAGRFCAHSGAVGATVDWTANVNHAGSPGRRPSESKDIGDMGLVPEARRSVHRIATIGDGPQSIELGDGPPVELEGGRQHRTTMQVRITPR